MSKWGSHGDETRLSLDRVTRLWHRFRWWIAKLIASRLNTDFFFFFFLGMNDVLPLGTDTFAHLVLPQGPAVHVSIKRSDDATASQDQNSSVSFIAPDWYCLRWYQDLAQTGQDGPGSATQQFCLRGKASQTLCGLSPNPAPVALISFENSG